MELTKTFKKEYKQVIRKIKEFDTIVVFRHQRPDYDAFGSQLGLAYWLKDSLIFFNTNLYSFLNCFVSSIVFLLFNIF